MKDSAISNQFSSLEEREKAIDTLETEIDRLLEEIDKAYSHLGRSIHAITDQETVDINEKVDKVVVLKQKLRKLRERNN